MNRRQAVKTLATTGAVLSAIRPTSDGATIDDPPPTAIAIQEAIRLAEAHVRENQIVVGGKHIASAVYRAEDDRPRWVVTWRSNRKMKGGWFEVLIGPDRQAEARFGE